MLPYKWCVKLDSDNGDILDLFIHSNLTKYVGYNVNWTVGKYLSDHLCYLHYPQVRDRIHSDHKINKDYVEISFEHFKKHIINKEVDTITNTSYLIPILKKLNIK